VNKKKQKNFEEKGVDFLRFNPDLSTLVVTIRRLPTIKPHC